MTDAFKDIAKLEGDLWEAADNLRANSKLTSSDYFLPGLIFLRHAANRFDAATAQIAEDQTAGRMPKRKVLPADYLRRRAMWLAEKGRYDLMRLFNSEKIRQATGAVFGRIDEYYLAKFSIQKAYDNGEFFTPSSYVQTIVNIIEPTTASCSIQPAALAGCSCSRVTSSSTRMRGCQSLLRPTAYKDTSGSMPRHCTPDGKLWTS